MVGRPGLARFQTRSDLTADDQLDPMATGNSIIQQGMSHQLA
ncbi:hypothetical protein [Lactiplantibacillus pentosus]|nr:hypothetical protein [Lactiplantibacillus pentosus]